MEAIKQLPENVGIGHYEYEDTSVLAADFGPGIDVSAEVVDSTVIVFVDGEQHEIDLPEDVDAQEFMKNGVLTIEVDE